MHLITAKNRDHQGSEIAESEQRLKKLENEKHGAKICAGLAKKPVEKLKEELKACDTKRRHQVRWNGRAPPRQRFGCEGPPTWPGWAKQSGDGHDYVGLDLGGDRAAAVSFGDGGFDVVGGEGQFFCVPGLDFVAQDRSLAIGDGRDAR